MGSGALNTTVSPGTSPFEGGHHYCHYPYQSWASGQIIGREHSSTHQQKIGLKICQAWPCPAEQNPDSPTDGGSHQEAPTSLLSFSIRGQAEWKQLQKTNQTDHRTTASSNSVKLRAMPCGATETDWSRWRGLAKRGPLEKGMADNFSVLAL